MAKNKQSTFADLVADSELKEKTIQVSDHFIVIRELTGRERFELAERADDLRWNTLLWVAFTGLIQPKPDTLEEMEALKPDLVVPIANAILELSGMAVEAEDEAENESASVTDIGGS